MRRVAQLRLGIAFALLIAIAVLWRTSSADASVTPVLPPPTATALDRDDCQLVRPSATAAPRSWFAGAWPNYGPAPWRAEGVLLERVAWPVAQQAARIVAVDSHLQTPLLTAIRLVIRPPPADLSV